MAFPRAGKQNVFLNSLLAIRWLIGYDKLPVDTKTKHFYLERAQQMLQQAQVSQDKAGERLDIIGFLSRGQSPAPLLQRYSFRVNLTPVDRPLSAGSCPAAGPGSGRPGAQGPRLDPEGAAGQPRCAHVQGQKQADDLSLAKTILTSAPCTPSRSAGPHPLHKARSGQRAHYFPVRAVAEARLQARPANRDRALLLGPWEQAAGKDGLASVARACESYITSLSAGLLVRVLIPPRSPLSTGF